MAHLLDLGRNARDPRRRTCPPGRPAEEVRSLAALQAALDGHGGRAGARRPAPPRGRAGRDRGLAARGRLGPGRARGGGGPGRRRRGAAPLPVRGRPAPAAGDPGAPAPQARAGHRGPAQPPRDPAARERARPQGRGAQRAQQDRGGALRRARHRQAARADPAARAARSPARTRAASTSSSAAQEPATGTATGCASSSPRTTRWSCRSRSSRCPSTRPRSPATSPLTGEPVNVADAYHLPDGLALHASAAPSTRSRATARKSMLVVPDARPPGRGDRRRPAHQQEARPRRRCSSRSRWSTRRSSPSPRWTRSSSSSLASQAAVAFENADLIQRDPEALRLVRPRRGDRDRAARPHDLRPLRAGGHAHRRPRREGRRGLDAARSRDVRFTPRPAPGAALRRASSTTSARSAVQEKVLIKGKKLYAAQMIAIRQRFAYILKRTRGRAPAGPARGARVRRAATPDQLAAIDAEYARAPRRGRADPAGGARGQRADGRRGGELPRAHEPAHAPLRELRGQEQFPVEDWAEGPS